MSAKYKDTSRLAWQSILPFSSVQKRKIINEISVRGPMMIEEIADFLRLRVHAVSGRITDLQDDGLVEDSGEKRLTTSKRKAILWQLTDYAVTGKKPAEAPKQMALL